MKDNWIVLPQNELLSHSLSQSLNIHPLIAQLLINRNITQNDDAKYFLEPRLQKLHDPFLFKDMTLCVDRIIKALENKEKVIFYGDYDVDGITGSALLSILFSAIGIPNECYIPHRINEGYGLSVEGINCCAEKGAGLVITVDCGIHAFKEIKYAQQLGIDVIITDHHESSDQVPDCVGVLNPKVSNSGYPYNELAGVGVAFKLAHALIKHARQNNYQWGTDIDLKEFLDLVALGTIADIVPLTGENRILVKSGFERLSGNCRKGIEALKNKAGIGEKMTTFDVAFKLAPRLNATGRLGDAKDSLLIVKTESGSEADYLANNLDSNNRERQRLEEKTFREALSKVERTVDLEKEKVIVVENDNWPVGVVGIVASKLSRQFHRPVFVISSDKDGCKGSGRSIKDFDLSQVLNQCEDLLDSFGGHKYAAGIVIQKENVQKFRERINTIADTFLTNDHLIKKITIDTPLRVKELTESVFSQLERMQPFGQENPEPVFVTKNVMCDSHPVLIKDKHVKFSIRNGLRPVEIIGFNMGERFEEIRKGVSLNIVYRLIRNHFRGIANLQINLTDFDVVG